MSVPGVIVWPIYTYCGTEATVLLYKCYNCAKPGGDRRSALELILAGCARGADEGGERRRTLLPRAACERSHTRTARDGRLDALERAVGAGVGGLVFPHRPVVRVHVAVAVDIRLDALV